MVNYCYNTVFSKSSFREQVYLFISLSLIWFTIRMNLLSLFETLLASTFVSIFIDNILGQGAPQKPLAASRQTVGCAWLVATRARHGAENRQGTILIDFCTIFGRFWSHCSSMLVDSRDEERENDKIE